MDANADQLRRQHELVIVGAWYTAAYQRQKHLPDLRQEINKIRGPVKVSKAEVERMRQRMKQLQGRYRGR